MARSPDRLSPEQKDAIYEMKRKGWSGRRVAEVARSKGWGDVEPFKVSAQHVNEVYRRMAEEKGELYESTLDGLTAGGALDKLTARLLRLAERELQRQERLQRAGKLDGAKLGKLASALEKIHRLDQLRHADPGPTKKGAKGAGKGSDADAAQQPASTFAEQIAGKAGEPARPVADRVIPGDAQAAPTAPPPQPPGTDGGESRERSGLEGEGDGVSGRVTVDTESDQHDQRHEGIRHLARDMGELRA